MGKEFLRINIKQYQLYKQLQKQQLTDNKRDKATNLNNNHDI